MVKFPREQLTVTERNAGVVRRAVEEIWNQGELDVADELFTAGYANWGGLIPDLARGPEAVKLAAAMHHTAFPNLRLRVEALLADGDMVAVLWRGRGTPLNMGSTVPPGDHEGTVMGMTFCRMAGGKIAESWTTWDSRDVLRQMTEQIGRAPFDGHPPANGLNEPRAGRPGPQQRTRFTGPRTPGRSDSRVLAPSR